MQILQKRTKINKLNSLSPFYKIPTRPEKNQVYIGQGDTLQMQTAFGMSFCYTCML